MHRVIAEIDGAADRLERAADILADWVEDDRGIQVLVDRVGEVSHEVEMMKRTVENYE